MTSLTATVTTAKFQDWEISPSERRLVVRGEPVALGSRAFDVLCTLVAHRGRVVLKHELLDAAWPGLVVEENNISVQIAALRKLLGAKAIATVQGLGYRLSAAGSAASTNSTTPPLKPELFGRDADIVALTQRLATAPLVCIVGTGGVGKTSLARAVVANLPGPAHDGVHWVDLALATHGSQFTPLLAKSLGIELSDTTNPAESLLLAMTQARALVTIDNCEHVVAAVAAFVRKALERAPGVRWLATSQEPLRVFGEVVYRLGPLDVPTPDATLADAGLSGAIALLQNRAASADRGFALTDANLPIAIDMCRQLDGLPLAIEMAAARITTLGLRAVHEQLGRRLGLLAGPRDGPARHHNLRSAFEWSYALLSPAEQALFRCLEPFRGGFSLAMAQRIVDHGTLDDALALEALSGLVDKSLVHVCLDEKERFHLFESAREYAREQLIAKGEMADLQRRHADVVAAIFDNARADHDHLRDDAWTARYLPERYNVGAALAWVCAAPEPDLLARLVAAQVQIDLVAGGQAEVLKFDIPMAVMYQASLPHRASACLHLGWAHYIDGSRKTGSELAQRALDDFTALGDPAGAYRALAQLIRLHESRPGMADEARRAWESLQALDTRTLPLRTQLLCKITAGLQHGGHRSVEQLWEWMRLAERSGFDLLAAMCRVHVTDQLLIEARFQETADRAKRFLEAEAFLPRQRALILVNRMLALVQLGLTQEARMSARAALRTMPSMVHVVAGAFALAAARDGKHLDAALLAGFVLHTNRERDERPDPAEAAALQETVARLELALEPARLRDLLIAGAGMATPDIVAMALAET